MADSTLELLADPQEHSILLVVFILQVELLVLVARVELVIQQAMVAKESIPNPQMEHIAILELLATLEHSRALLVFLRIMVMAAAVESGCLQLQLLPAVDSLVVLEMVDVDLSILLTPDQLLVIKV